MNNNPPAKQFTPEQRNLLCLAYERHKGKARGTMNVQEEFRLKYPDSKVPLQSTIYRIYSKNIISVVILLLLVLDISGLNTQL